MKVILSSRGVFQKVFTVLILLFMCIFLSIGINYNHIPVFIKSIKKLPIYSVETSEKKVAITFDVGWGDDYTDKILETLKQDDTNATFFIIGKWAEEFPDEIKKISESGSEIGNHSYLHPDMTRISKSSILKEINKTDSILFSITGKPVTLFRCPSGTYNDLVIDTVNSSGHNCIQWDVDSIDWKEEGADREYNRVIRKVKPGSIILFHNTAKYTPNNLKLIIKNLKDRGYSFVKVSDLIYKDNYYMDINGKQIQNTY